MRRDFLKVVGQSTLVRLGSAGVAFALSILLARSLGPQGFGTYSFAFSILSLAVLIAQLGFPDLIVREVARLATLGRTRLLGRFLRHATVVIVGLSLAFILVIAVMLTLFGRSEVSSWKVILAGLPLALLTPLLAQSAAVLRGTGKVVQSLLGQQLYRPALFLALVGGALLVGVELTAVTAMGLHALATLLVLIEVRLRASRALPPLGRPARVPPARLLAWTSTAVMFSGVAVVRLINTKFDTVAIGMLMSDANVGLYAAGAQLSQSAAAMLMITAGIVTPAIARASAAGNDLEVERQCRQSALMSFSGAVLTLALAALAGRWVIATAFGPEYVGVWPALMVLVAGQAVNAFVGPVGVLLNMRGQERSTLTVTLVASLANIGLNFALIPHWGMVGAASATVASMVLWNVALWVRAWQLWGINSSVLPWPWLRRAA
ncbi:hypothetical protein BMI91_05675 [Thioclava sediminum]|uniref:Polysaccharide biosynthesis protein C-terminal domain-containing protein n=1 Tax=Thioclava sediminum TaxID=1915319 RepID=A0ABX3N2P2_9RHOB|nr:flippase [Thioclava sediminum]OOY25877.1 hypothetical protein BMI91_05675 [Thioclava sediminum]